MRTDTDRRRHLGPDAGSEEVGRQTSSDMGSMVADVIAVFTLTMATVGMAISMAVLVFSDALESGLPRSVGTFVVAGGVLSILVAARSRIVPVATIIQDGPAIVTTAVAADFMSRNGSTQIADVFVLLLVTTTITGVAMWLLGRFRLGGLVRYMPTTVVGAFIAGTGWLLLKGGFDVMVGSGIGISDIDELLTPEVAKFWLPGLSVGLIMWGISKSKRVPAFMVGLIVLGCVGAFYLIVLLASSIEAVEQGGWLIGPFPESAAIGIVTPAELGNADWAGILGSVTGIASVIGLAAVALLLNLSGIGSQVAPRLDVDDELRICGGANLIVAPLGTVPGFHAMGDTLMLSRLGARRRAVPIATGATLVVLGFSGVGAIGYVPRLVIGGLLVMVGVGLLESWLQELRRSVSRAEQLLSISILLIIAWFGILQGIGAGLVAACALFIVRYSRVDPVRDVGNGRDLRSRVDRSPNDARALEQTGDRLRAFQLQGYLFFGSLTSLEDRVHTLVVDQEGASGLDAVILDFKGVTGIDPSGYSVIARLLEEVDAEGIVGLASSMDKKLLAALLATEPDLADRVQFTPTLDLALERCEEQQLDRNRQHLEEDTELDDMRGLSAALLAEFEEIEFEAGAVAMEQGSVSDGMMVVQEGSLTAIQVGEDQSRHRLRRFGAHAIVGEIGVITGRSRTAEIVAETHVTALWLPAERYTELRESEPELIFELHELILKVQAERVVSLSKGLARSLQ